MDLAPVVTAVAVVEDRLVWLVGPSVDAVASSVGYRKSVAAAERPFGLLLEPYSSSVVAAGLFAGLMFAPVEKLVAVKDAAVAVAGTAHT